jgi:hypothetical protein
VTRWEPPHLVTRTLLTMIQRLIASLVGTVTAAIAIAAAATVLSTSPALACSCVAPTPPAKPAPGVTVFTGTVSHIEAPGNLVVHLVVETVYQGSVPVDQTLTTTPSGASCGYGFEIGQRYTIFSDAAPSGGPLSVGLCGGVVSGAIDPAAYGLTAGAPPTIPGKSWPWGALTASLVGALAIAAAIAVIRLRREAH